MKIIKLIAVLFVLNFLSGCSSTPLHINVVDSKTKQAVPNAYVYVGDTLYLSDAEGNVSSDASGNNVAIFAGKDGYFVAFKPFKVSAYPKRNGEIYTGVGLYPQPNYPERLYKPNNFSPSEKFSEAYIENTPNMKEFLTYLLANGVSVYNFSATENVQHCLLKVARYPTKEPLGNCYVMLSKKSTMFSPQEDVLFMTDEFGTADIPINDYDDFLIVKDGYSYVTHNTVYSKAKKERHVNLTKCEESKRYLKTDKYVKISGKLLSEYPTNKMLQDFLATLKAQNVIIARMPENEIFDF